MPYLKYLGLLLMALLTHGTSCAQSQEIQQLLLNVEKLTQFKAILSDMQRGYTILHEGYGQVRDLTQGNFNLHQVFLDGLLQVNPEIRKYARVADLIADQASILSEYKKARNRFTGTGRFNAAELKYITQVYTGLTKAALRNLNELADVLTASKLRMSDDERLRAIDRLYADTHDQLQFLRSFNRRTSLLQVQRQNEKNDIDHLKKLYQP